VHRGANSSFREWGDLGKAAHLAVIGLGQVNAAGKPYAAPGKGESPAACGRSRRAKLTSLCAHDTNKPLERRWCIISMPPIPAAPPFNDQTRRTK